MTTSNSPTPGHVVIVGGGVAGLEALLALQALAGDRVDLTLVSQHDWFVDRPVTVAEPFGLASAARHSVPDIVAERGATVRRRHRRGGARRRASGQLRRRHRAQLRHADPRPRGAAERAGCRCDRVRARRFGPGDRGDARPVAQRRGAQRGVRRAQHDGVAPAAVRACADDRTRARPKQRRGSRSCASSARRIGLWRCSATRAARAPVACWPRRGSSSSARPRTRRPPITSSRCRSCAGRSWPAYRPRRPMASLRSMSMGR